MGRSKIDISQIGWSEIPTGSLAGPASFVGLDTSGSPVLIAASNYVSAGGGSGISHDGSTADGVLTYKDSDEATVESGLTFNGTTLLASADDVRIRLNGDTNSHPGLELAEAGTRKWIVYNNYTNDDLTFKTDSNIRMVIEQDGDVKIGAGDLYVDKIRRASDSDTTTKILLNDEAIKLYAGHSSDNICTIDSTGLKIDNGSLETATIDYTDGDLSMTIADGGKVTFASGFAVGSDAAGDILYHNGTSYIRLAKGSADQVLTMNDAATAPNWEDASGGTDTYTLTERGHAYMGYPHRKYLHYPGGFSSTYESSREWAKYSSGWGHSQATSIDTTPEEAFVYWATFVVPADCTVDSAVAWYKSNQSQNTYIGIYSADMSSADDSASNVTFEEMKRGTSSGNTSGRSHKVTLTSLSNNSLSAGDIIAVALDGNQTSNTSWSAQTLYFHIAIKISPS